MSIFVDETTKVIYQGLTGSQGSYYGRLNREYGTQVVAGTHPKKAGSDVDGVPIYANVAEAVQQTGATASCIFIPAAGVRSAVMEAAEGGIKVLICITEGIPVSDMIKVKEYLSDKDCRMVGPNCPGVISADEAKVGIMPGFIFKKGNVGIVSKSGTLTYEAVDQVTKVGLGQTTAIGVGGDPIIGTTIKDAVELLMNDNDTHGIIMIGEIGGNLEAEAGKWIQENGTKPVVAFIAGDTAPKGRTMGHAGAIVGGHSDTASAKKEILKECGVHVVDSPADLGTKMFELLSK